SCVPRGRDVRTENGAEERARPIAVEHLSEAQDSALRDRAELQQAIAELARAGRRHEEERARLMRGEASLEVRAQDGEHVLGLAGPVVDGIPEIATAPEARVGDRLRWM